MEETIINQEDIPTKGIGRLSYCSLAIIPLVILSIITFIILFIVFAVFPDPESWANIIALIVLIFYSLYFLFISYKRIQNIGRSPLWLIFLLGFPYVTIITLLVLFFIKGKYKDVLLTNDNKITDQETIISDEATIDNNQNTQPIDNKDINIANLSIEEVFARLKK